MGPDNSTIHTNPVASLAVEGPGATGNAGYKPVGRMDWLEADTFSRPMAMAWGPVSLLVALALALRVYSPAGTYGPDPLLPVLNLLFLTTISLLIAALAAESFMAGGPAGTLFLGAGLLAFGLSSALSSLSVYTSHYSAGVCIHNIGALFTGICTLAGAVLLLRPPHRPPSPSHTPWSILSGTYLAILIGTALIATAAWEGWLPVFFIEGRGATPVRQAVLAAAILSLFLASGTLLTVNRRQRSAFLHWYALGLLLLALGLTGLFDVQRLGSARAWAGRTTQYVGGLYLLAAALAALYQARNQTLRREGLGEIFRYTQLVHVAPEQRSSAPTTPRVMPRETRGEAPDPEMDEFLRGVLIRASLDPERYQSRPLRRRIPACLRALRVRTIRQAQAILDDRPELLTLAVNSLLIGVTEFFRDAAVFDALRIKVLPDLLNRSSTPLRIWSAGCSSGQELYSLALLLAEMDRLDGAALLGTDCRQTAIETARKGRYPKDILEPIPPPLRDRYFESEDGLYCPVPRLRAATRWKAADVLAGAEPGPWDLILWRNAAIYLTPAAARQAWELLVAALRPGGFLVTGPAERPGAGIPLTLLQRCIYRRNGD